MDSDKIIQELNRRFAAPLPEFYKRRIVEDELKLPQRFTKLEVSDLVDTEMFPCLDEVILIKLMKEISDYIIDVDEIKRTVEKRRTCVNYEQLKDYYEGILQVANMQAFYKEHTTGFHSAEAKKVWFQHLSGLSLASNSKNFRHRQMN